MESAAPSTEQRDPSFAHATVDDAMHPAVLTCDPATPLVTVAQRMSAERIHSIVMLAGGDDPRERIPWAVVTDMDLLRHAGRAGELTAGARRAIRAATASSGSSGCTSTISVPATVTHAVVVERSHGRPIGVLSALDIARVVAWGRA